MFLSYRRQNSAYVARTIFQHLRQHGFDVFMDVESLEGGQFTIAIERQIAACAHFVVVLAPGSLERTADPEDVFRCEIQRALELGRNVVPVLMEEFSFDVARSHLTGPLEALAGYNAVRLFHEYVDSGLERLRRFLGQPTDASVVPVSAGEQARVGREMEALAAAPKPTPEQMRAEELLIRAGARSEGEYEQIVAELDEAIQLDPGLATAYVHRAYSLWHLTEVARADADVARALELEPALADAYAVRALLHLSRDDPDAAGADCDRALGLEPGSPFAMATRARARVLAGDVVGAESDCDLAIRINPQYAAGYLARANVRLLNTDLRRALGDANEAVRLEPGSYEAFMTRGAVRCEMRDMEGGLADLDEAVRLNPRSAMAFAGRAARRAGADPAGAMADVDEALRLWPGFVHAIAVRARVHLELGNVAAALWDCDHVQRSLPNDLTALLVRGLALAAMEEWDAALEPLDGIISRFQGSAAAYGVRAQVHRARGRLDAALTDLDQALRLQPGDPTGWLVRGQVLRAQADFAGAVQDFSTAIRHDPSSAEAFTWRAEARVHMGDVQGALQDARRGIELGPNALAHALAGELELATGGSAAAWAHFDQALRLQPDLARAHLGRAQLRPAEQVDLALADLDAAEAYGGDVAQIRELRTFVYLLAGRLNEAALQADAALSEHPSAHWFGIRAQVRMIAGEPEGALADLNEAVRLEPDHPGLLSNRADARDETGDHAGALADYTNAIRLEPRKALHYLSRALIYERLNRYEQTAEDLQRYLDLGGGEVHGNGARVEGMLRRITKLLTS